MKARATGTGGRNRTKILAIIVAIHRAIGQKSARNGDQHENGGEREYIMKTIKSLTLLALAAAALTLSACEAKTSAGSSGVQTSASTTSSGK